MSDDSVNTIRLRVAYQRPESLLGALTKGVSRGGVRVVAQRRVSVGTRFLIELRCVGIPAVTEVTGRVVGVSELSPGQFVLLIRYELPADRRGLDVLLAHVFEEGNNDFRRGRPRVPLQLRAVEQRAGAPSYRLHDLSASGVGVEVEDGPMPSNVKVGTTCALHLKLNEGVLEARGEVVWVAEASATPALPARFGVRFEALDGPESQLLEKLVALRALPAPPWIAILSFGQAAPATFDGRQMVR